MKILSSISDFHVLFNRPRWAFEERRQCQVIANYSDPGQARNSGRMRVFFVVLLKNEECFGV